MTPFKGDNVVTSTYGPRKSPINGKREQHKGQDIVTAGQWPGPAWLVRECTGGRVLRVSSDRWRGLYVDVETRAGTFERYQHLHEVLVHPGQAVPQGTVLGMAGKSGDSTGVHLHFEVQKNGAAILPSAWSGVPNTCKCHPGNSQLDNRPAIQSPKFILTIGPADENAKQQLVAQAKALGLACLAKETTATI